MSMTPTFRSGRPRVSAGHCLATGVGGAAMVGLGVLLAAAPGASVPSTTAGLVALVSFDSVLAPQAPGDLPWWESDGSRLIGSSAAAPTPTVFAAVVGERCGLICNGADGTAANPDGQDGGLLFGRGGSGVDGGRGGDGGMFGGSGGNGGNGVTAGRPVVPAAARAGGR